MPALARASCTVCAGAAAAVGLASAAVAAASEAVAASWACALWGSSPCTQAPSALEQPLHQA